MHFFALTIALAGVACALPTGLEAATVTLDGPWSSSKHGSWITGHQLEAMATVDGPWSSSHRAFQPRVDTAVVDGPWSHSHTPVQPTS
jgi:hypothetical protein